MLGCGYHRSHTRHWFFVDHGFVIVFFILPLLPCLCSRMIFLCFSFTTISGNLFHPSIFKSFDNIWYMAEWLLCISLVYSLFFSSFVSFQLLSGPLHVWCLWSHIGNTYHFPLLHFHSLLSCSMWLLWPAILILFPVIIGFDGEKIQANPFLEHFRFAEFDLDAD